MKRYLSYLLVTIMAVALLGTVSPAVSEAPAIVEISITMFDRGVPADAGTADENNVTRFINEKMNPLGVNITWKSAPRNDARTIYNTWIAAGTAPDILWEYSRPWMDQLRMQKTILPLEDLIEKYSTEYKEYAAKNADLLAPYVTFDDGHTYAACSLRGVESLPVAGIWYRKDMLDKAGYTGPLDTMDDIVEASRAVKAMDSSMVPITTSLHYQNIIYGVYGMGSSELIDENGDLIPVWESENYRDASEMLRLLYQEGLVDKEYLTDENYSRQVSLVVNGKSAFAFEGWNSPKGWEELNANEPTAEWQPLGTVATDYGRFMLTPQNPAYIYIMFNSSMTDEKIEAGFKYIDWLLREKENPSTEPYGLKENWQDVSAGMENIQWQFNEAGLRQSITNCPWWGGGEYALVQNPPKIRAGEITARATDDAHRDMNAKNEQSLFLLMTNPISNVLPYDFTGDDYVQLISSFNPMRTDIQTLMYTAPNYTIQQGIDEINAAWESLNGPAIWAEKNAWYHAQEEKILSFRDAWTDYMSDLVTELAN